MLLRKFVIYRHTTIGCLGPLPRARGGCQCVGGVVPTEGLFACLPRIRGRPLPVARRGKRSARAAVWVPGRFSLLSTPPRLIVLKDALARHSAHRKGLPHPAYHPIRVRPCPGSTRVAKAGYSGWRRCTRRGDNSVPAGSGHAWALAARGGSRPHPCPS